MTNTVAKHIVETLIEQDFTQFYCIPGVQNDDFFDTLYDFQDKLPPIHSRHEQGASYMALGAALATGKPQVFSIVPGPGFLNGATALATAYSTNAPVLAMIGHIPSKAIGKGFGLLHEIPKQTEILETLTKSTHSIRSGEGAKAKINQAFSDLLSGRPRPVGLEVPVDVWKQELSDGGDTIAITKQPNPTVNKTDIDNAIALIKGAKNPLIVVGGGAQDSSVLVTELAKLINAPVSATRMGHGVLSSREDLSIVNPMTHKLWGDVDLVIGLGTRLQHHRMQFGVDEHLKIIHVDIDRDELERYKMAPPTVGIHAHLEDAIPALMDGLKGAELDRPQWLQQVATVKQQVQSELADKLAPQIAYISAIRNALPDDGIYVEELTQIGYVARIAYPTYQPRTFISHGYQGTLGWGLPTALGVAHARRDVPVVSISGDGGFMFTMPELATAVYHNIPLNIVVFNDGAFGNVKRFQIENYNNRAIASDLANPDFKALAETFGIPSTKVSTPEDLQTQLQKNIQTDGPTFIEVSVGDFPSPWDYILMPKVRG